MPRKNPAELEIDLFCHGVRVAGDIGQGGKLDVFRTRAGLGSGIEAVLPGPEKDIWLNIPVQESFAGRSPYELREAEEGRLLIKDSRDGETYAVTLKQRPRWYDRRTSSGTPMSRIGVMQGTYLGIYVGKTCSFWLGTPSLRCGFCTTGVNIGAHEEEEKSIDDVVEVANVAKAENGISFVHFNSGFHHDAGVEIVAPYVKAVKERVGAMVGVQLAPDRELWKYEELIDMGVEHFSFCYEFHNPEYFSRYLPGKQKVLGRQVYFDVLESVSKRMGKGRCSGEIIAGLEPLEDTLEAIDYITSVGAFPTVCIFRPLSGSDLEQSSPPEYEEMLHVFRHMIEACRKNSIPIGMAPNIEVSLVVLPTDALYLAPDTFAFRLYKRKLGILRMLARPYFVVRMRKHRLGGAGAKLLGMVGEEESQESIRMESDSSIEDEVNRES